MIIVAVVGLVYAAVIIATLIRVRRATPVLADLSPQPPATWPRVSIVIAARDEAETIEAALTSKLAETYPDTEVVVVDDRSRDATGAIIARVAARDPRVVPVRVDTLPDGWLGKVHALARATERATGEWLLFSDADVHHDASTLTKAIAYCEANGIDHLCALPELWSSTPALDIAMNSFLRLAIVGARPWAVADPRSRAAMGGGNFNLVRRSALARTPGFEWLRLEVIDDVGLGQMLKRAGARSRLVNARGLVKLHFYRSLREMYRGAEKNAFALLGRFSLPAFVAAIAALLVLDAGPVAALAAGAGATPVIAGAALALGAVAQLVMAGWLGRPRWPALFGPLGTILVLAGAVRATALTLARGGIVWRDTFYSLDQLRGGMRLEIT